MDQRRRQQSVSYYHPGEGWSDDPQGATLRLSARLSGRVTSVVDNDIAMIRDGDWVAVDSEDERTLAPAQRGLVWYGWRSAVSGQPLLMLRGVRAIDEMLASTLLDGLVVFDHQGDGLDEPTLAGLRFALRIADAGIFASRVKSAGGHILPVEPDLGEITRHHQALARAAGALEEAAGWAAEVIAAGGQGITLDLHRIGERAEEVWSAHRDGRRAIASLAPAHEALAAAGRTMDEQVAAERLALTASDLERRAEEAFALYRGCERQAVALLARHGQEDGIAQHLALVEDDGAELELLGQLAARLTSAGQDARLEVGRLVVSIPGGEVVIGGSEVRLRR